MKRRNFIKSVATAAGAAALVSPMGRLFAAPAAYEGKLLITLQAEGGWDPTSYCDPKLNVAGEQVINHWASSDETRTAGNLHYAPFANNSTLFDKYYNDMLIINGVDAQTNAHSTGVVHNWSGRNSRGYPSLTALFSAYNAPDIPLSYINYGGFAEAARLIRYSRLDNVDSLINLLQPNRNTWNPEESYRFSSDIERIVAFQQERLQRKINSATITPRQRYNAESYFQSRSSVDALKQFADVLPASDQFQEDVDLGTEIGSSNLLRQIQLTMLAMKSGVASAADLFMSGYDTHNNHDRDHAGLFTHLNNSIDYFWSYAEEQGIADRITLVIASDFGRTPFYNANEGKDHWPIGSVIVMEKNASWGNRVVGLTDEGHNAHKINPSTLQRDDANGSIIYPKHIHKAIRRHLGLEGTSVVSNFIFSGTEDFDFFNDSKQTAGRDFDARNSVRIV